MRYWALCFLVIFLSVLFVPLIAEKSVAGENLPEIEVNLDGNIEKITIEEYVLRVLIAENSFCENAETKAKIDRLHKINEFKLKPIPTFEYTGK